MKFIYGFTINDDKVLTESLEYVPKTRKTKLFTREGGNIRTYGKFKNEGKDLKAKTREDTLFLTVVASFNGKISNIVMNWLNKISIITERKFLSYSYHNRLLKDKTLFNKVSTLLKQADPGIVNIIRRKKPKKTKNHLIKRMIINELSNEEEIDQDSIELINVRDLQRFLFTRKVFDKDKAVGEIPLPYDFESDGTKQIFEIAPTIVDTLTNEKIVFIDELSRSIHPLLSQALIILFNEYSNEKAQLIFTTHNTNLLKKEIFRRDQIYFTEKDQYGRSELFSLYDFKSGDEDDKMEKIRDDATFYKDYLLGKYGAIPDIDDMSEIFD